MNCRKENNEVLVAVIGRPTAGHLPLIKAITGTKPRVKRWSGATADENGILFEFQGRRIRLVVLPGTSISPRTREEGIARDYLVGGTPDLILNVVDATDLERDLSLTIRLMELGMPIVMALNRCDVVEARGCRIDVPALEAILQIAVVPTATRKKNDPEVLMQRLLFVADNPATVRPRQFKYGNDLECASEFIEMAIGSNSPLLAARYPLRWLAYKVIEGDPFVQGEIMVADGSMVAEALHQLRRVHGEDLSAHLAAVRAGLAGSIAREALVNAGTGRAELAERIVRGGFSNFLTVPVFLTAIWLVLTLTFGIIASFSGSFPVSGQTRQYCLDTHLQMM